MTKKQKMDKVYKKLHPAITHINCSPDIKPEMINLINIMAEKAFKMKIKPENTML